MGPPGFEMFLKQCTISCSRSKTRSWPSFCSISSTTSLYALSVVPAQKRQPQKICLVAQTMVNYLHDIPISCIEKVSLVCHAVFFWHVCARFCSCRSPPSLIPTFLVDYPAEYPHHVVYSHLILLCRGHLLL